MADRKVTQIFIYFDADGNWKDTRILGTPINAYPGLIVSGDTIKDSLCIGNKLQGNPFIEEATCLDITDILESTTTPNWLLYNIQIDKDSMKSEGDSRMYDRTTIFSVAPLPNYGSQRTFLFWALSGYYYGYLGNLIEFNRNYDDRINEYILITISLDSHTIEKEIYGHPYYCTKKDGALILREIEEEGETAHIFINISADGKTYNINLLSLDAKIYGLGVPEYLNITKLNYITEVPAWVHFNIEDHSFEEDWDFNYHFWNWLILDYSPNTSTASRVGTMVVESTSEYRWHVRFEIHLFLDGNSENPDIPDKQSLLLFEHSLIILPASRSSEIYSTLFHYNNINVNKIKVTTTANWLSVNISIINNSDGNVQYSWESNELDVKRSAIITLLGNSTIDDSLVQAFIEVVLSEKNSGEDIPIELDTTGIFIAIDTNNGESYDSNALLFKDNTANTYSTLETKDNTLFLGNYLNSDFSLKIYNNIVGMSFSEVMEDSLSVPIASKNVTVYSYTPDMSLSSLLKRLFKKGETYSLGLVFVRKDGSKSSVFYVGDFSPSVDPIISIVNDSYYLRKPLAKLNLTSEITAKLNLSDVIGIIPVVAERGNHKIICQGFLNSTISSNDRRTNEGLTSLYNWFLRLKINDSTTAISEKETLHNNYAEFLSREDDDVWTFNSNILTMNTPELEAIDSLTDAELENCTIESIWKSSLITYTNSVQITVNGKYLHSRAIVPANGYRTDRRETSLDIWHGFIDKGDKNENTDAEFISSTKDNQNYGEFYVYPWQRNTIGGEGPESTINSKKYFTSMYIDSVSQESLSLLQLSKASIYRDNFPSLLKFGGDIYLGAVDYIINITKPYKAFTTKSYEVPKEGSFNYPRAFPEVGVYSGYSSSGEITDPISMKYKSSPHVVLHFNSPIILNNNGIIVAELLLSSESYVFENDPLVLSSLTWIKCGDIVPISTNAVSVYFTEGDYFYGRFDTLRTYPYTQEDVNSITDIVSGMLCSRINLDSRCDRNRGIGAALVTPENFNLFNEVYNLSNNYFKFLYFNLTDKIYDRRFSNSVLWSMSKSYGNEIDDWCNILDANTLDLDGDKGKLNALKRLNNNLIAFQDTGISQVLYNETMQVASTDGVPIEIANSGKVNGKRYLLEAIGCQNEKAITSTPNGLYFIDALNKSFYKLGTDNSIVDLCINGGMKSWGLSNLDDSWKCWYDSYSKEVILTNPINSLIYSDIFNIFQCFSNYENIYNIFSINGITYLFKENTGESSYNNVWLKNAINASAFFDEYKPLEIEIIANPEPTIDKTFTNIEYRADCFLKDSYKESNTFNTILVWNEYQDTGIVNLVNNYRPSNLKKKFRIWHIDIPRNAKTMDRIRNPWCSIKLTASSQDIDKFILHDILVLYM